MKSLLLFLSLALPSVGGVVKGVISAPDGLPVPRASVQARNLQTGASKTAVSSTTGEYTLSDLAAGVYDISVTSIRFLERYEKKGLAVDSAEQRLDVQLDYITMGGTPGEGPQPRLAGLRRRVPEGPPPRRP